MPAGSDDGDLLEGGTPRAPLPAGPRRAALALGVVAAVAVGAWQLAGDTSGGLGPAAAPSASPTASPGGAGRSPLPLPAVTGACGDESPMPERANPVLAEPTGLRVLVGGTGLRLVDVDSRAVRELRDDDGQVTTLRAGPAGVFALERTCERAGGGVALLVDRDGPPRKVDGDRHHETLLVGPGTAWGVPGTEEPWEGTRLRPLGSGTTVDLPLGFTPVAAGADRFVGVVSSSAGELAPVLATVRRPDGATRLVRPGRLVAASDAVAVTANDCEQAPVCRLSVGPPDGPVAAVHALPGGRVLRSAGVLSPDGRRLAVQVSSTGRDGVWPPTASSEVAVLDLRSGRLQVVGGLEVPPRATVGLAFSRDGRWLVLAAGYGTHTHLLVWREGLDAALDTRAELPGLVGRDVPVLDVTGLG